MAELHSNAPWTSTKKPTWLHTCAASSRRQSGICCSKSERSHKKAKLSLTFQQSSGSLQQVFIFIAPYMRPSTVFQFKSSSVLQFWPHVNSTQSSPRRLCLTLTRTLLFLFLQTPTADATLDSQVPHRVACEGRSENRGPTDIWFYCNLRARRRVQRDSSHLTNRRGIPIGGRCATRPQRAGRAGTQGAARVNGSESLRAT
jgi:hypothetical protein